jgi:DNA-binding transcriptional MerR regulator
MKRGKSEVSKHYQVQEFAEITGVTVRALHHYDRLALLRPRRTTSGYRQYGLGEVERLEQIVALKFLGLPLRQIKTLLDRDHRALPEVLRAQRRALEEKRRQLDKAILAIRDAERVIRPGQQTEPAVLRKIIEVIEMQDNAQYFKQFYSDEAWSKLAERREKWDPAQQEQVTKAWTDLFRDVEASLNEDPASEKVQALAARWKKLVEGFTGGDPQIGAGLKKVWTDQANWPGTMKAQAAPFADKRIWDFMGKAMNCGKS